MSGSHSRFTTEKYTSNFLFVDLAGSERQSKTEAAGRRLEEAKFINKSLSALGKIVAALSSKGTAEMKSADSVQGAKPLSSAPCRRPARPRALPKIRYTAMTSATMTSIRLAASVAGAATHRQGRTLQALTR